MLGKLRATNNADIRRVLGMPSKEADRCVKADDPGAECDAWLVSNTTETRDTAEAASMTSEGVKDPAPAAPPPQRGYTDDDLEEAIKAHPGNALNAAIVLQQAPGCVVAFRKRLDFAAGMM